MQLVGISVFDPARTAEAITPLLLEMPSGALFAINKDLEALLDHREPALRSTAVMLQVRAGAPLAALAERDAAALLKAVNDLPADQAPDGLADELLALVDANQIEPAQAFSHAARLSRDRAGLFKRLAGYIDAVKDKGYDQWGPAHHTGMAALGAMHRVPEADWPAGYEDYRIARADPATLEHGREYYHEAETGCVKCHGERGEGAEGFPPLAGSPTLLGDPARAASIVKHGLMGELEHTINPSDGKPFNAQMENLSYMSEGDIAAVLTYVRQSWGNFASPVTLNDVTQAPGPPDKADTWQANVLFKTFPYKRDRLLGALPGPTWEVARWKPPSMGVIYMLITVTVAMLFILVPTSLASKPPSVDHAHTPAAA